MTLDLEKFEALVENKKEAYSKYTSALFFKNNQIVSPCSMGEKATILYHLLQREISFNSEEFTDEEKKEVEDFIKCLESQMNKIISGELTPVDMLSNEILDLIRISDEEILECLISKEDILTMMQERKDG